MCGRAKIPRLVSNSDKRQLTSRRVVQYPEMSQLYKQKTLIERAEECGWIGERFKLFIKNHTGGSAVLESTESISKHPFVLEEPFPQYGS